MTDPSDCWRRRQFLKANSPRRGDELLNRAMTAYVSILLPDEQWRPSSLGIERKLEKIFRLIAESRLKTAQGNPVHAAAHLASATGHLEEVESWTGDIATEQAASLPVRGCRVSIIKALAMFSYRHPWLYLNWLVDLLAYPHRVSVIDNLWRGEVLVQRRDRKSPAS